MAKKRAPAGITVSGAGVWVKDPEAAAGSLFSAYVRIPGTGSITLPDESAPQNDSVGIDGVVSASGFAGVGSITVPLPQLGQHPAHRFLAGKRRNQGPVIVGVHRKAQKLFSVTDAVVAGAVAVAANGVSVVTVTAGARNQIKAQLLEGLVVSISATAPPAGLASGFSNFADFSNPTVTTADSPWFQTVVEVEEDGSEFSVAPGFTMVNVDAFHLYARQPGKQWLDVACTVAQMGDGDFQASSVLSGNLVFTPSRPLPLDSVVVTVIDPDPLA